jgi:hypothetical protein
MSLVVEEDVHSRWGGEQKRRWRRATFRDLAEPEMRALIDLRFQPQFMTLPRNGPDLRVQGSTALRNATQEEKATRSESEA